jgi:hypothetical protein
MDILILPQAPSRSSSIRLDPITIEIESRPMRVLDFDIENRPLSYLGSDFTTAEVTAISWAWVDRPKDVTVYLLGETELPDILRHFLRVYEQADMVTGHYIRGHDLPMINGALMECQMPVLGDKMTSDTKLDLVRAKGISLSQESLGAMFRLEQSKVQMNQIKWRAANRLTPEGLAAVRERVVGDVAQHVAMRRELLALNYLAAPKMWRSGTAKSESYTP